LEDFQVLMRAYQQLQAEHQQMQAQLEANAKELKAKANEVAIKDEALHRQGEDLKKAEAELVWLKAALQQAGQAMESQSQANWQEKFQRLQADTDNLRKRWEARFADEVTAARHRILLDMLPLADHLDLALAHADRTKSAPAEEAALDFVRNIAATRQAFLDTLQRYGVRPIGAVGEPFDPNQHEAIGQIDAPDAPADHVAQVVQAGYVEADKLLRPARVLVTRGGPEATPTFVQPDHAELADE
jgi:molecular chaperone GrpE